MKHINYVDIGTTWLRIPQGKADDIIRYSFKPEQMEWQGNASKSFPATTSQTKSLVVYKCISFIYYIGILENGLNVQYGVTGVSRCRGEGDIVVDKQNRKHTQFVWRTITGRQSNIPSLFDTQ